MTFHDTNATATDADYLDTLMEAVEDWHDENNVETKGLKDEIWAAFCDRSLAMQLSVDLENFKSNIA